MIDKSWTSLTQVREYIERKNEKKKGKAKEKIISFDGIRIITNKYKYTLAAGELRMVEV